MNATYLIPDFIPRRLAFWFQRMVFLRLGLLVLVFRLVAGVIVDDTSNLIIYSNWPAWQAGSSSRSTGAIQSGSAYGGTWHEASLGTATFKFTFTGTSVAVYGIVFKNEETLLGFTIDGGTETQFDAYKGVSILGEDYDYGVQVFKVDGLNPANHTISMICHLQYCIFGLDYIEYTPVDVVATTATTGAQTSSQATSGTSTQTTSVTTAAVANLTSSLPPISMSIGGSGTYDPPTIPPSASPVGQVTGSSTSSQGSPNTAAIVGGVIGGAAVLALLIFGIYLSIRRQRRNEFSRPGTLMGEQDPPVIVPDEAYVIPLSEKQQLVVAEREAQRAAALAALQPEQNDPIVYQSFTKPMLPRVALSPSYEGHGENESDITSNYRDDFAPDEQEVVATQYQHRRAADVRSFDSPYDNLPPLGHLVEGGGYPLASGASHEEANQPWPAPAAPPYVGDVLARPDARNLSENDVDMIARRLAEVMTIQNTARGGPGLLRERTAPPRELLDRLVEEHLGTREHTS